jgi:hypothetical protein
MADKRRARSGGKTSVHVVVSSLEETTKLSAPSQTNVTFRPQQSGRLGQSVEHMPSENTSDVLFGLPELLEIPDDDDDECDEAENEADVLENNFFGPTEHTIPDETKAPVSMRATTTINCVTFKVYI